MNNETKKSWAVEDMDNLRSQVRSISEKEGLKLSVIAPETGIPYGTFTSWLNGTYAGDNDRIATAVEKWLQARNERAQTSAILPTEPGFQTTPTAEKILALLSFCHHAPDFGVISGGAGIGKTTTIESYRQRAPNVFVVTAEPVAKSSHALLMDLAEAIGVVERSPVRLSRAIQNRLKTMKALLVVDEAQHLPTATLEQLRTIHDLAKCGLVLSGNQTVYSRLAGGAAKAEFAQLFSRVGMKMSQDRPLDEDVVSLARAWGVTSENEINLLRVIGRKPGALRGVAKTIRLAHMVAIGSNETLSERHIRAAWKQRGSDPLDTAA
ncbi:AAA family ATPase [Microvirga terricola]|uniref:AAA family ATPase n=1 Tax=Microvirga terricola TaxID=2719797 RepID=A0ABX0V6F6_9HYPH|nr:AAA family ATPase [Microvirga terricola]NIX75415.1 AAA family ATPase [Microvirga terricola]